MVGQGEEGQGDKGKVGESLATLAPLVVGLERGNHQERQGKDEESDWISL
jgi:hypothetical protein